MLHDLRNKIYSYPFNILSQIIRQDKTSIYKSIRIQLETIKHIIKVVIKYVEDIDGDSSVLSLDQNLYVTEYDIIVLWSPSQ